jgi:DNA-binding MarR family transcriptional regulator
MEHMELLHRFLTDKFDWYETCLQRYDERRGHVHVKPSLVPLLKQMERGQGARMHLLAVRMGVTRRRVSQIVAEGVESGMLTVTQDPDDARAAIVRLTDEGQRICDEAIEAMHRIEAELIKRIGARNVAELLRLLKMDWGPAVLVEDSPDQKRKLANTEAGS